MRKSKIFKLAISTFIVLVIFILFVFSRSYRFTPMQAIMASLDTTDSIEMFGEVKRDWATVYLLDTSKGLKTVLVSKRGFMWHCSGSTYFFDDAIKNDAVKTVGWMSVENENNKQITVFAVQTNDPRVKFIEAGLNVDRKRIPISLNETVIFSWDKKLPWNDLKAIALDKDNIKLYRYGYPENTSFFRGEDLRWYPYENK